MMKLRRKFALLICPELADLPYRSVVREFPRAQSARAASDAERLMRLDQLYAASTGVVLKRCNAPDYSGSLYEWPMTAWGVKSKVISVLYSLRAHRQGGVSMNTAFIAINYFSSIWPDGLKWPADIPRPEAETRRAS